MRRAIVLTGLAWTGLLAATAPSQAYWVRRGYYLHHYYYRPYVYGPRVVVVPRPPVVVVRPAPVVVIP